MALALIRTHAWKLGVLGVALALGLALALNSAEASGDPYGDGTSDDGGIAGNASDALGAPDTTSVEVGTAASAGGSLTVNFSDNVAFNGTGTDIVVHVEPGGDAATATIAVSNGGTFIDVGNFDDSADVNIDLQGLGLAFATAVRVTYVSGTFPGFNLDAVETLNVFGEDAVLDATPNTAENPGFTAHTVTANLSDDAAAIEGATVTFLVTSGPNAGDGGTVATDASGDAEFTYDGDGGTGIDTIDAWLDINGNGVVDAGEPADQVTKEWHGVTGTILLDDANGGDLEVGDEVLVTVDDRDLDITGAPDTASVLVTSTTDGVGFLVTLTETGDSTGVFTGSFTLGAATDVPTLVLAVVDGDDVTGSYDDALDDEGNDPAPVIDTLIVGESNDDEDDADGDKVTICHMPPGNPGNAKTLSVGASAEPAHLAHGDTLGECDEEALPPTKQEQQLDDFCERQPDHKRCEGIENAEEGSSSSAASLQATDEDDDTSSISGASAQQAANDAFCERKPDHKRCDDGATEEDGD